MKSWKTTLAGLLTGMPVIISAVMDAYNSGQFVGKTAVQIFIAIGIILMGYVSADHSPKTT